MPGKRALRAAPWKRYFRSATGALAKETGDADQYGHLSLNWVRKHLGAKAYQEARAARKAGAAR